MVGTFGPGAVLRCKSIRPVRATKSVSRPGPKGPSCCCNPSSRLFIDASGSPPKRLDHHPVAISVPTGSGRNEVQRKLSTSHSTELVLPFFSTAIFPDPNLITTAQINLTGPQIL